MKSSQKCLSYFQGFSKFSVCNSLQLLQESKDQIKTYADWGDYFSRKAPPRSGNVPRCFWLYLPCAIYKIIIKRNKDCSISPSPKLSLVFVNTSEAHQQFATMKKTCTSYCKNLQREREDVLMLSKFNWRKLMLFKVFLAVKALIRNHNILLPEYCYVPFPNGAINSFPFF